MSRDFISKILCLSSLFALVLAACGSDSGNNADGTTILSIDSMEELPNCSQNREGMVAENPTEKIAYICLDGRWEFGYDILDSIASEDDLPVCLEKSEGDSIWVVDESSVFVCKDRRWVKSLSEPQKDILRSSDSSEPSSDKSDIGDSFIKSSSSNGDKEKNSGSIASSSSFSNNVDSSSNSNAPESSSENVTVSSATAPVEPSDTFTDPRNGKIYKIVRIGNQVWFAQNLNLGELCPGKVEQNCEKYGSLHYLSNDDRYVCPEGWHVPSSEEWEELFDYVSRNNGGEPIGVSLKATTGWIANGDPAPAGLLGGRGPGATAGTDRFGFAALPAGSCWGGDGTPFDVGDCYVDDDAHFLVSNSLSFSGAASQVEMSFDSDEVVPPHGTNGGYVSVRCLKGKPVVNIDAINLINGTSFVWTDDLTHDGSNLFTKNEASAACPEFFYLPHSRNELTTSGISYNYSDYWTISESVGDKKRVRCYSSEVSNPFAGCTCNAETKDNSVTWSFSGCTTLDGITDYEWKFDNMEGVEITSSGATKVYTGLENVQPIVKLHGYLDLPNKKKVTASIGLSCPSLWYSSLEYLVFGKDKTVSVPAGKMHRAVLSNSWPGANETPSCHEARVSCSSVEKIIVSGEETGNYSTVDICGRDEFTIEVSQDAECGFIWW